MGRITRFGVVFRGASGLAMTGPYKRKKYHYGDTHLKKGWRVKRRTRWGEARQMVVVVGGGCCCW